MPHGGGERPHEPSNPAGTQTSTPDISLHGDGVAVRDIFSPGYKHKLEMGQGAVNITTTVHNTATKNPLLCNFSRGEVDAYGTAVNDHRRQNLFLAADRKSEFKDEASVRAFEMTLGQPGIADLLGSRLRHVISHWRNRREHEWMEEGEPLVSDDDFLLAVRIIFNQGVGTAANAGGTPFQRAELDCKHLTWRFNGDTPDSYIPALRELINIEETYARDLTPAQAEILIKIVLDRVRLINSDVTDKLVDTIHAELKNKAPADRSLAWLQLRLSGGFQHIIYVRNNTRLIGHEPGSIKRKADPPPPKDTGKPKKQTGTNPKDAANTGKTGGGQPNPHQNKGCTGCGRKGHPAKDCFFKDHPDFNKDASKSFADSKGGKFWKDLGEDEIPWSIEKVATSEPHKAWRTANPMESKRKDGKDKDNKRKRGTSLSLDLDTYASDLPIIAALESNSDSNYLLPVSITLTNGTTRVYRALVDTGALDSDYCSHAVGQYLLDNGVAPIPCKTRVGSALGSSEVARQKFCIRLILNNEITKQNEILSLVVTTINIEYDLIIGRPSIQKYGLLDKLRQHLLGPQHLETHVLPHTEVARSTLTSHQRVSNLRSLEHVSKFLDPIDSADGIEFREEDAPWQREINSEPVMTGLPTHVVGSPEQKATTLALLRQYESRFSSALQPEPMKVDEPMEIKVDMEKWEATRANRAPPRTMSLQKNEEIRRQLDILLARRIVRTSKADKYCQVLLTPKPNGKWRFCVDYGPVNDCSEREGWPIPNIQQMLRRIGSTDPQYFAVMDLTSGYHQAPIHPASIWLTAFITIYGVFEWLRVPMGLKGAPSYFQKVMATVVLAGLLYVICDLYLDDILVYGSTFEEYLANLEQVLKRLEQHNITVNPEKCRFNLTEVEYVGHVLSNKGMSFTKERREEVFNMEVPTIGKHLKSFIGCAEYFRDHIVNLSEKLRPLHAMIVDYDKNRRLVWTPEARQAWDQVREDIRNVPTLYFIDTQLPVYLHTDASDYGIGAYLFQVKDDIEHPIMFMSKTLSEAESRWNTTEKECYAIVYAFKKFEHLIRDIPFILRTDHRNLVYINETKSSKILRWKLLIQEYDFHIEHIPGKDNTISDTFSRVVPRYDEMYSPKEIQNIADPDRPYRTVTESLAFLCNSDSTEENVYALDKFEIPRDKYRVISAVHNSRRGHFGVEKTMKGILADMIVNHPMDSRGNLQIAKPWKYMREHVKRFIRCCPCCQKMSMLKTPIETLGFSVSSLEPMERLAIDTIGPLPADNHGNKYIIAISDHFTRWIELYAAKDTSAQEALRALMLHNKTFGQPSQIVSDNGSQYVNDIVAAYLELLGTEHVRITAYSHEENSIVERSHRETLRHLRALVYDAKTHDTWSQYLGNVQHIMNNTVHESIGVAPARLVFGGAITLDRSTYLPVSALNYPNMKLSDWAANQLTIQSRMLDSARDTQRKADLRHEMEWRNDLRKRNVTITIFPKGTLVKVQYPHNAITGQRAPNKLTMPWRGPYEVMSKEKSAYIVKNIAKGSIHKFSEHLLDVYHVDTKYSDPRQVALDAENMYDIAEILQIQGNDKYPRKKSEIKLLISWQGYEQDVPTWNVWNSSFNHNTKVHDFLRTQHKKWHWLIPPEYR